MMERRAIEASGGCQCGAVRYQVRGAVTEAGVCHCRMCQKAGGNFGMAFFAAPILAFTRGSPSAFQSSPGVMRGFCAQCGTPLYMRYGDKPFDVTVGSLDDPDLVPVMKSQIGIESQCRWFRDLATVPTLPTSAAYQGRGAGNERSFQHPDHDTTNWPEKSE